MVDPAISIMDATAGRLIPPDTIDLIFYVLNMLLQDGSNLLSVHSLHHLGASGSPSRPSVSRGRNPSLKRPLTVE